MKILVVEDDPIQRHMLLNYLQKAGHQVLQAADGLEGWEIWRRESVRFVITDWMMPKMDGAELIRQIRAVPSTNYTYIVMLTAREGRSNTITGLETGTDDFLVKPFDPGELKARIAIGERILELESRLSQALNQMEELATLDHLTGLLNRRAAYERMQRELQRTRQLNEPFSIILLDIDHFKRINDKFGHAAGDLGLRAVAEVLQNSAAGRSFAGRWGGEEFIVILPATAIQQAGAIAEDVRSQIQQLEIRLQDGGVIRVQASLGVACHDGSPVESLDNLLQKADQAMYQAKNQGRNRVCVFSSSL